MNPRVLVPMSIANGLLIQGSGPAKCDLPLLRVFLIVGAAITGIYMLQILINHATNWVLKDRTIDVLEQRILRFLRGLTYLSYLIQFSLLAVVSYWLISNDLSTYNGRKIIISDYDEKL